MDLRVLLWGEKVELGKWWLFCRFEGVFGDFYVLFGWPILPLVLPFKNCGEIWELTENWKRHYEPAYSPFFSITSSTITSLQITLRQLFTFFVLPATYYWMEKDPIMNAPYKLLPRIFLVANGQQFVIKHPIFCAINMLYSKIIINKNYTKKP